MEGTSQQIIVASNPPFDEDLLHKCRGERWRGRHTLLRMQLDLAKTAERVASSAPLRAAEPALAEDDRRIHPSISLPLDRDIGDPFLCDRMLAQFCHALKHGSDLAGVPRPAICVSPNRCHDAATLKPCPSAARPARRQKKGSGSEDPLPDHVCITKPRRWPRLRFDA